MKTPIRTRLAARTRPTPRTRITPRPDSPRRPLRLRPGLRPAAEREKPEPVVEEKKESESIIKIPESNIESLPEKASESLPEKVSESLPEKESDITKSEVRASDTSDPFSFFDFLPSSKTTSTESTTETSTTTTTITTPASRPTFRLRLTPKSLDESTTTKPSGKLRGPSEFLFPLQPVRTTTQKSTTPKRFLLDIFDEVTSRPIEKETPKTTTEVIERLPVRVQGTRKLTPRPVESEPKPVRTRPPPRQRTTTPQPRTTGSPRPSRQRPLVTTPLSPLFPVDYDYVYDFNPDAGALGGTLADLANLSNKATLHKDGTIECSDTGYFPHPNSCKKFISCSKTVRGFLRGWIYTCPQELVFDPVGGMCNWTEDVDCSLTKEA